jgi:hypothetical protein
VVSKTVVTQIASKDLPADTFAIPAGFSKQEMPAGRPMGAGMSAAPPPASSPKSPE